MATSCPYDVAEKDNATTGQFEILKICLTIAGKVLQGFLMRHATPVLSGNQAMGSPVITFLLAGAFHLPAGRTYATAANIIWLFLKEATYALPGFVCPIAFIKTQLNVKTMAATLKVMTYNTHLFGKVVGVLSGAEWKDDDRFIALTTCIKDAGMCGADIISIEEGWSDDFIEKIQRSHDFCDLYPYQYFSLQKPCTSVLSNPSGLLLLTNKRVVLHTSDAIYYDYTTEKGDTNFGIQDIVTSKGFYKVPATVDGTTDITLLIPHIPTDSGTYTTGVQECFQYLTQAIHSDHSPVLLLGDFNFAETNGPLLNGTDRDTIWVGPKGICGTNRLYVIPGNDAFVPGGSGNTSFPVPCNRLQ